jgi:cystathionine gamma-synthase
LAKYLEDIQLLGGAVLAPFDCWLVLRGLKTLVYRVEAQAKSALRIATWLTSHPRVSVVNYPGLTQHPGHTTAAKQMRSFGSLMSFQISGNEDEAMRVVARARQWSRATSLGSVESLIEHRASMEGSQTKTPRNLIRLSVGLEHVNDLISDLEQALSQ